MHGGNKLYEKKRVDWCKWAK